MTTTQTELAPAPLVDHRPWATYERRSKVGKGAALTMDSQHRENTGYLHSMAGEEIAIVDYRDNASGWNEDAHRADWERLLVALASGEHAGVAAWHSDRYTRQPAQLEQLIAACRKGRAQLHTRMGGHHSDPVMIRIEMAIAAKESDNKSHHQKLKQGQLARDGKPHGGRRAYGYNAARTELVEAEAAHIRWAAQQVLAGRSIRSITAGLAERGSVTVSGAPWRPSNLGTYLRRPMLAGLREHKGKVVGQATWPALLDLTTHEAVASLLNNPERRVSKRAARVYLLTAIARCGGCGGPMRGRSNASNGKGSAYFCDNGQGCAYRRSDLVDAQVRAEVVSFLALPDAARILAGTDVDTESERELLTAQITEVEDRLKSMVRLAMAGSITDEMLTEATTEARTIISKLSDQRDQLAVDARRPAAVLTGLAGMADAAERFDALTLEAQRAVVSELCTVTILPSPGRGRAYDPELVQVQLRG